MTTPRDALDAVRLRARIGRRGVIGRRVEVVAETTSTSDVAWSWANDPAHDGWTMFAESQSSGRGQRGRAWSAPAGSSLLFSFVIWPTDELLAPAILTAWSAVAVAKTLSAVAELDARIKWPNDVRVAGRKIAGILVERRGQTVVVGIGLNVAQRLEDFPPDLRMPATSVQSATGRAVDRAALAGDLLIALDDAYVGMRERGPAAIFDDWQRLAEPWTGKRVVGATRRECFEGTLLQWGPDRPLRLESATGVIDVAPEDLLRVEPIEDVAR